MSAITTHVLDLAAGRPAAGVAVVLEHRSGANWREVGRGTTDADGRLRDLLSDATRLEPGPWRLTFATGAYFAARGAAGFHPEVAVTFTVREPGEHHHVPLLVSPYGYTTYRGS